MKVARSLIHRFRVGLLASISGVIILGYQNCSQTTGLLSEIEPTFLPASTSIDAVPHNDPIPTGTVLPTPEGKNPDPVNALGGLKIYFDFEIWPAVHEDNISEADALLACQASTELTPYSNNRPALCTWESKVILEKYRGECSTTVDVCRHGIFVQGLRALDRTEWTCKGAGKGSDTQCQRSNMAASPTGTSQIYIGGQVTPNVTDGDQTESEALGTCILYATRNPTLEIKCIWDSILIFNRAPLAECSTTPNVCRKGISSDILGAPSGNTSDWTCTTLAGGPTVSCSSEVGKPAPLGLSQIFFEDGFIPSVSTANITEAGALENCILNYRGNPSQSIRCTWEKAVLLDTLKEFFPPGFSP